VPLRDKVVALRDIKAEVELGFDVGSALKSRIAAFNCDVADRVSLRKLCIECDACVDICPMECITSRRTARSRSAHAPQGARQEATQDLYVANVSQDRTRHGEGRDVCLHCGLCASAVRPAPGT